MVWRPLSFFILISMLSENIQFYLSAYLLQQCNKQGETCKQNLHDHAAAACHQVTPLSAGNKIPHRLYQVNILARITGLPPGLDRSLYKTAEETTQRAAACSQLPLIHKPVWICFGWCHLVFPVHRGHCMLLVQHSVTTDSLQKLLFLSWCLSGQWQQGSVSLKELSRSAGGKATVHDLNIFSHTCFHPVVSYCAVLTVQPALRESGNTNHSLWDDQISSHPTWRFLKSSLNCFPAFHFSIEHTVGVCEERWDVCSETLLQFCHFTTTDFY